MRKLVVFDMDGTIADTSLGIINCHKYAHQKMNAHIPTDDQLFTLIGAPLLQTYQTRLGFSNDDAKRAVEFYRSRYADKGINEATLYPGMQKSLLELKKNGYLLAVATLKAEHFAKQMLKDMGILHLFDCVFGVDRNDTRTKAQLVEMCMNYLNIESTDTVLVGDTFHDLLGAQEAKVKFIAVTYGFGFKIHDSLKHVSLCHNAKDIPSYVYEVFSEH